MCMEHSGNNFFRRIVMKAGTARKILCNDKLALRIANNQGRSVSSVRNNAKSLLNRLHKRARRNRAQ